MNVSLITPPVQESFIYFFTNEALANNREMIICDLVTREPVAFDSITGQANLCINIAVVKDNSIAHSTEGWLNFQVTSLQMKNPLTFRVKYDTNNCMNIPLNVCPQGTELQLVTLMDDKILSLSNETNLYVCREFPISVELSIQNRGILTVFIGIILLFVFYFSYAVFTSRRSVSMKKIGVAKHLYQILGWCLVLVAFLIYTHALPEYRGCEIVYILIEIGTFMVIISSLATFWRLDRLFNNKEMSSISITDSKLLKIKIPLTALHSLVVITLLKLIHSTRSNSVLNLVNMYSHDICITSTDSLSFKVFVAYTFGIYITLFLIYSWYLFRFIEVSLHLIFMRELSFLLLSTNNSIYFELSIYST